MTAHEELEVKIIKLRERARVARKPYTDVAEWSRRVYGSEPEIHLSARAPATYLNFYKNAVRVQRGKVIQGDPHVKIESRGRMKPETVQYFRNIIDPSFSSESCSSLLQNIATDTIMFTGGYEYIHDVDDLEHLYWFDVFIDNALSTPKNIFTGRYLFIRRYIDAEKFWDERKDELSKINPSWTAAEDLPTANDIEGRYPGGTNAQFQLVTESENNTNSYIGNLFGQPNVTQSVTSGAEDGLVCEWECFIRKISQLFKRCFRRQLSRSNLF